ncbi:MAG: hypothetical protein JWL64_433 [Frankiales bacterium]|nr:hypothetical protein [Frankiales bacterium]
MSERLFFVFSNPTEGQEREFNDWYDNTHLDEVLAVPNISGAQRYTLDEFEMEESEHGTVPPPAHRYLAVYEVDGDPAVVMKDFTSRLTSGDMTLSPALDFASVSMGFWSPAGPHKTSG